MRSDDAVESFKCYGNEEVSTAEESGHYYEHN